MLSYACHQLWCVEFSGLFGRVRRSPQVPQVPEGSDTNVDNSNQDIRLAPFADRQEGCAQRCFTIFGEEFCLCV